MAKNNIGKCKLCGKTTILTFEHVPPNKAFNFQTVTSYSVEDFFVLLSGKDGRMPWDFSDLKGTFKQKGAGDYYLCNECNNNTGSWYMADYVDLTKILSNMIANESLEIRKRYHCAINKIKPLNIYKAIMTMFCDINCECFGDEQLRNFVLNKESTNLDLNKYSIYIYLVDPNMQRRIGLTVMYKSNVGIVSLSEVSSYPLGATLYIDKPDKYKAEGVLINNFVNKHYDEICDVEIIGIPYLQINSLFPVDFRSKEEIIGTLINSTEEKTNV